MRFEWCISSDRESPADGEKWSKAKTHKDAVGNALGEIKRRKIPHNPYQRFLSLDGGRMLIDFGSHSFFVLVRKIEEEDGRK